MSFEVQNVLKECLEEMRKEFPVCAATLDANYVEPVNYKAEVERFKILIQPHFMAVIKKDDTLFKEPQHFLRGVDFSALYIAADVTEKQKEAIWNYTRMFLMCSYLGSDIMETVNSMWTKVTGKDSTDEVDEILRDGETQGGIHDLLETLKDTRIFKLGMEVMENINVESLGLDSIDFTDVPALLEMVKNPDHPVTKKAISAVQKIIEQKMRTGSLKKEDFIHEIEMLKEKFKNSLGKIFKSELFGETTDRPTNSAETIMSNHPDARRARMLARLQRKVAKK
jgi:hypothetical protein